MPNEVAERTQIANPFNSPARQSTGLISVEQQRAVAQVQAAIMVARSFPRIPIECMDYLLQDCTDPDLAEEAEYEFSRGGSKVTGPSIRLLEAVARRWGNMESGVKELSRQDGYSECEAYSWDMESNNRDSKIFQVKHWRDTKQGGYQLKDERDIYELIANMGARRKRACMEAVIPKNVINKAMEQCELTLKTKIEITPELIATLLQKFGEYKVTKEMIEKRIQRHVDALTPGLVVQLRRIYNSLKDGMSGPHEWFDMTPAAGAEEKTQTGAAALKTAATAAAKGKQGASRDAGSEGQGVANVDKSTGEMKTSAGEGVGTTDGKASPWEKWQAKLAKAKDGADLDFLRSAAKELTDTDNQLAAVEMLSRRAAEIAAAGAGAK